MKVLLRSDIAGVGRRGDIISVSGGHARNFLFPQGLAIEASDGAVVQANVMRKARDQRESAGRADAQALSTKLMQTTFTISAKVGKEGRLFGSVSAAEIAEAVLSQAGIKIDRKQIVIAQPLRTVGEHSVLVGLFSDVEATIKLAVVAL